MTIDSETLQQVKKAKIALWASDVNGADRIIRSLAKKFKDSISMYEDDEKKIFKVKRGKGSPEVPKGNSINREWDAKITWEQQKLLKEKGIDGDFPERALVRTISDYRKKLDNIKSRSFTNNFCGEILCATAQPQSVSYRIEYRLYSFNDKWEKKFKDQCSANELHIHLENEIRDSKIDIVDKEIDALDEDEKQSTPYKINVFHSDFFIEIQVLDINRIRINLTKHRNFNDDLDWLLHILEKFSKT